MTFRQLELLVALGANQSIAATAIALDHSPATVSRQISALEKDVGVALLNRNASGVTLSPAGHRLCERAGALLEARDSATRYARDGEDRHPLRLGTPADFVDCLAARIGSSDSAHGRTLELVTRAPEQLVTALLDGSLDWALLPASVAWPGLSRRFSAGVEYFHVVANHAVFAKSCNDGVWIRGDDNSMTQRLMKRWLRANDCSPSRYITATAMGTRIQLALAGIGYTLAPKRLVEPHIQRGELTAASNAGLSMQIVLGWYSAGQSAPTQTLEEDILK
ncbi:LysR family transcriptional regulator [Salinisphaera hydrothermalis]|uniref:LysR family transcriptional regulator n=1 Tax=Salinisphaera hydrothermalis TaxID=563188 RepID=UPI0033426B72